MLPFKLNTTVRSRRDNKFSRYKKISRIAFDIVAGLSNTSDKSVRGALPSVKIAYIIAPSLL